MPIALSGYGMVSDVRESHAAGFQEHITKPVNMKSLLATLNRVANMPLASSGAYPATNER